MMVFFVAGERWSERLTEINIPFDLQSYFIRILTKYETNVLTKPLYLC